MRISKKKLSKALEDESLRLFTSRIKDIKTDQGVDKFLNTFFTQKEREQILRRSAVLILLKGKTRYIDIENDLEISKATISKIKQIDSGYGYGRNLKKIGKRTYSKRRSAVKSKHEKLFRPYKGAESII